MKSMDEIYQKYAKLVYRYLLSKTRHPDLAEELTQETFYQAVRRIHKFDGSCKISTWLCAIAKNQMIAYQRKHPEALEFDESVLAGEPDMTADSAERQALQSENRVEIMRALHLCQEPYREVLYLRIFGNLSFREIGEIMEKTENWARVTYYRGREKLREKL